MLTFEKINGADLPQLIPFEPPGWGDLVPRFQYFIDAPFCHPIKLISSKNTVAIGTSICHADTAWLACIITHPEHRRQGYGQLITRQLIEELDCEKYKTIYLDATEMGYPVYQKLGFRVEGKYVHLKRQQPLPKLLYFRNVRSYQAGDLEEILALDHRASGEYRLQTLKPHLSDGQYLFEEKQLLGFYLPTLSDGLIVARSEEAGSLLLTARAQGRPFAILPDVNHSGLSYLEKLGYHPFRKSTRMILGSERRMSLEMVYNRISGALG